MLLVLRCGNGRETGTEGPRERGKAGSRVEGPGSRAKGPGSSVWRRGPENRD